MAGLSAGLAHIARVKSQRDKTPSCQFIGIDGRSLLLHAAIGSAYHQGGALLSLIQSLGNVEIAREGNAVTVTVANVDSFNMPSSLQI